MRKAILFFTLFALLSFLLVVINTLWDTSESKKSNIESIEKPILITPTPALNSLSIASEGFYNESLKDSFFNGSILVAQNGKIIYEKYNGLTNINIGNPIDSNTSFHLASVSKTFTAMAVLKLMENNLVSIDSPVVKFLPKFPYNDITIQDLLTHRSGLANYVDCIESFGWNTKKNLSNEDLLNMIIINKKKFKIGKSNSNFAYSNTNYALLALVIEKISKKTYSEFLQEEIVKPFGMKNTFVFNYAIKDSVLQSFKENNDKEKFTFLDLVYGDKNIYSTTRDLLKWDQVLYGHNFLKKETLEMAFKGYSNEKKGIKNYGLGWRMYDLPSGKKIIYHNGWWHGNNTFFNRFPDDSTTIIVLGNKFNNKIYDSKKIIGIYNGYDLDKIDEKK